MASTSKTAKTAKTAKTTKSVMTVKSPKTTKSMAVVLKTAKSTATTRKTTKTGKDDIEENDEYVEFEVAVLERDDGDKYGFGGWTPQALQGCRRHPVFLLLALCTLVVASSYIQAGVIPAAMTQWQRRFQFTVMDLALIRVMYEVGSLLMVFPVAYFAENSASRSQWIGMGGLSVGIGALLMIVPDFLVPEYKLLNPGKDYCEIQTETIKERCEQDWGSYKYFFMIGELLIGMGTAPHYIMGITYLDENVSHRQSGYYTFVVEFCQLLGPLLGYFITDGSLLFYGDQDFDYWPQGPTFLGQAEPDKHPSKDMNWYGAWWIAMGIGAMISFVGAFFMFPFPNELSGVTVAHIRDVREAMMVKTGEPIEDVEAGGADADKLQKKLKGVWNTIFIVALVEAVLRNVILAGGATFLTKYIEITFEMDAITANFWISAVVIPGAIGGLLVGIFIEYAWHVGLAGNLNTAFVGVIACLLFGNIFIVRCPRDDHIAGMTSKYPADPQAVMKGTLYSLETECNTKCLCQKEDFDPVCWVKNGTTFFSKCFAGCHKNGERKDEKGNKVFTGCECLDEGPKEVRAGKCKKCNINRFYAFLVGLMWLAGFLFLRVNPTQQLLLRSVNYQYRSIAMAVTEASSRFFAMLSVLMAAGIMYGTCRTWSQLCQKDKNRMCVFFKRSSLVYWICAVFALIHVICAVGLVIARTGINVNKQKAPVSPTTGSSTDVSSKKTLKRGDGKKHPTTVVHTKEPSSGKSAPKSGKVASKGGADVKSSALKKGKNAGGGAIKNDSPYVEFG